MIEKRWLEGDEWGEGEDESDEDEDEGEEGPDDEDL